VIYPSTGLLKNFVTLFDCFLTLFGLRSGEKKRRKAQAHALRVFETQARVSRSKSPIKRI
jgi:hypothetical protein